RLPRARIILELAAAALAVAAIAGPVAWPYYQLQREHGFVRNAEELVATSARPGDYFRVPGDGWNWFGLLPAGAGERELFHGFVVIVFALIGVLTMTRRKTVATYVAITALAFWLSLGPLGG